MKVLTFTTLFPNKMNPNFGCFIKERMKAWNSLPGNELVVVAPVPWFPPVKITKKWFNYSQIPKEEIVEGIKVYHPRYIVTPKIGMRYYGYSMAKSTVPFLEKLRKTYAFELIDAHYVYPDGVAARIAAKDLGVPFVISARGTDINYFPKINKNIKGQIKEVLTRASRVISVSQGLKDIMTNDLGVNPEKIRVIGNGVDPEKFYEIDKNKARKKCGLPANKKILLSVGALNERKNYIEFLKAINRLGRTDLIAVIIGEGDERRKIEEFIEEGKMVEQVILKGGIPHEGLKWWYSAADVFCHTSLQEGWPNVLMEALACAVPVVVTPAEGAAEIITGEDLGIIAEGFTAGDIEAALRRSLERKRNKEAIVERMKDAAWQNVAHEVNKVFEEVMGR